MTVTTNYLVTGNGITGSTANAVQALVSEAGDFVDLSYLSGWALAAAGPGYLFHDGRTLLHDGQPLASL